MTGRGFGSAPFFWLMNTKTTAHDTGKDELTLVKEYNLSDIQKVAEHSKAMASVGADTNKDGEKLVATVHSAVIIAWLNKRGLTMQEFMSNSSTIAKQFLEDADNAHFRVWKGKL